MLKKVVSFICAVILCAASSVPAYAEGEKNLGLSAKSAVLMNADNGQILFAQDENTKRPMASTTKIMTALLTLEAAQKNNKIVTITDQMVRVEGSSMGLRAGDRLSLKAIAAGMLTVSGNDAANSAAIAIGGSIPAFAELMNQRAKELGLNDTHFVTPSGLDDDAHYTTAHDLALLAAAAMKNPDFAEIASNRLMNIQYDNPSQTRRFTNHNKLLSMYDGCVGVKTGFTKHAGRCLVSAAKRDGIFLIAVTLNAPDDWNDHEKMLDYGFSSLVNFSLDDSEFSVGLPVVGGVLDKAIVKGTATGSLIMDKTDSENIKRVVALPRFVYAPIQAGQVVGTVQYILDGKTVAGTELVAAENIAQYTIPKSGFQIFIENIKKLFTI